MIVDIAAERGGNCELTHAAETVVHNGVTILGPVNMASLAPQDASQMYATNLINFLKPMVTKEGVININREDEIVRDTLVTFEGKIVHPRVLELMGKS